MFKPIHAPTHTQGGGGGGGGGPPFSVFKKPVHKISLGEAGEDA